MPLTFAVRLLPVIAMFPFAPDVPDTRLNRDPVASVSTLAEMPTPDELIAAASPASVLLLEFSVMVCVAPLPTCSVIDPASTVDALGTSVKYPLEVCARLCTTTECVPATAADEAEVSCSTPVSELDPVFCAMIPVKSVNWLTSFDRFESSVPRFEITVSWLSSALNCVFHGVSTFSRFAMICDTVALTSNPAPLVGDPKFSPTVPMPVSVFPACSRMPIPPLSGLEPSHAVETTKRASTRDAPSGYAARAAFLLEQLRHLLLDAVGLRQRRDAGLAQDLVLRHVRARRRVVGRLHRVLRCNNVLLLRAHHGAHCVQRVDLGADVAVLRGDG